MSNTATAVEAALREAIARHLTAIETAIDYPAIPEWLREFNMLAETEARFPRATESQQDTTT